MAADKQDLISWFRRGVENKQTHMIVVCDNMIGKITLSMLAKLKM